MDPYHGKATRQGQAGLTGESVAFNGVLGVTTADGHAGVAGVSDQGVSHGVYGRSANASGVIGISKAEGWGGVTGVNDDGSGAGVYARSKKGAGLHAESAGFNGVLGVTTANGHAGVAGVCDSGNSNGVYGRSKSQTGVWGHSVNGYGLVAISDNATGMLARGGRLAGRFEGDVEVTGDIRLLNADCAEDFELAAADLVAPGAVMILGEDGLLHESRQEYDKRVVGVVSGAGGYKPGLLLDQQPSRARRRPIALLGKVFCQVDATSNPIVAGDMLTTSSTPGHAMKASDPQEAFGAVIGKALRSFHGGKGLIPILVVLQ